MAECTPKQLPIKLPRPCAFSLYGKQCIIGSTVIYVCQLRKMPMNNTSSIFGDVFDFIVLQFVWRPSPLTVMVYYRTENLSACTLLIVIQITIKFEVVWQYGRRMLRSSQSRIEEFSLAFCHISNMPALGPYHIHGGPLKKHWWWWIRYWSHRSVGKRLPILKILSLSEPEMK